MKCPHCGKQNPIHQQYCASCGQKIQVEFNEVAESVRGDAEKVREKAYPALLLQIVILMLLANVAVFVVSLRLSSEVESGDVILPGALPPELTYDPPVDVEMPALPGGEEVTLFPLPTSVQKGAQRFGFRKEPIKTRLHATRGGNARALQAVAKGLTCLKRKQNRNGYWQVRGGWELGKASWGVPAVTGLAVLAILADGHVWTDEDDDLGQSAGRGVRYLISVQEASGRIGKDEGNYMYNHGIATTALCDAYAMSGMEALRPAAEKAVACLLMAQRGNGGWDYTEKKGVRANLAVSTWPIAALHSAQLAGLTVPDSALDAAANYVDSLTDPDTGFSGYDRRAQGEILSDTFRGATAMSLACRSFLGQQPGSSMCRMQRNVLLRPKSIPAYKAEWKRVKGTHGERNLYYYFYHGTMGLRPNEGAAWQKWYGAVSNTLIKIQARDGSWQPIGKWAQDGGRIYATAMAILTLQATYRFQ